MAFNVLDMHDSTESAKTKDWLISQQSPTDGGFLAFDYGLNSFLSNSTTTAQALIALSGKSWILKIFEPSTLTPTSTSSVMPTPTVTPTNTPTPTSTPIPTLILTSTPQSTSTPVPTFTPTPTSIPTLGSEDPTPTIISPTSGQILGIQTNETNKRIPIQTIIFFGLGILSLIIHKGIM